MKKQVRFSEIEWDSEGVGADLPHDVTLSIDSSKCLELETDGAEMLADKFGFCVKSFLFEELKQNTNQINPHFLR